MTGHRLTALSSDLGDVPREVLYHALSNHHPGRNPPRFDQGQGAIGLALSPGVDTRTQSNAQVPNLLTAEAQN